MQDVFIRASLIYKAVQAVQAAVKESESSSIFISDTRRRIRHKRYGDRLRLTGKECMTAWTFVMIQYDMTAMHQHKPTQSTNSWVLRRRPRPLKINCLINYEK